MAVSALDVRDLRIHVIIIVGHATYRPGPSVAVLKNIYQVVFKWGLVICLVALLQGFLLVVSETKTFGLDEAEITFLRPCGVKRLYRLNGSRFSSTQ